MSEPFDVDFQTLLPGIVVEVAWQQPAESFAVTVLFGPTGCGKTTVLRCIAGLVRPDSGHVHYGSVAWFDSQRRINLTPQARGVGLLFQDYALFPHLTVEQNLAYSVGRHDSKRVAELLMEFELIGLELRRPGHISGGQQQRLALARVLARRPRILLLDEPLSALDTPTREEMRRRLRRQLEQFGAPTVIVTHDRAEALSLADYLIVMKDGGVLQKGTVDEVFSRPADAAVARIVGTETVQPGTMLGVENGLATVQVGSTRLVAVDPPPGITDRDVLVCIRGEEVALHRDGGGGSPRNRLSCVVTSLVPEGPVLRVSLDCGFPLVSLVTRLAATDLGLQVGDHLTAAVKAQAVHLIPRSKRS
jgi:molybdate transport system ATP-binding protein